MAKKQMSFAEKALKHKSHKDWKTVKYVKSERSDKTGSWRFNESYIQLEGNENLDQALNRIEEEVKALAKEMASIEENVPVAEEKPKKKTEEILEIKEIESESKIDPVVKAEEKEPKQPVKEV